MTASPPQVAAHAENACTWVSDIFNIPMPLAAIIAALIGIAGVGLSHLWSKQRESIARSAAASREFRSAFADELATLESNRDPYFDIQSFLLAAYDSKHKAAIALFEGYVPKSRRITFRQAWHRYHSGQEADGQPLDMFEMGSPYNVAMFIEYSGGPFSHPTMNARELALCRMKELLSFAMHK